MTTLLTYSLPLEKQEQKQEILLSTPNKAHLFTFNNHYVEIQENCFDCGCLMLGYVEYICVDFQEKLEKFMHQNGYSKIIFTISIPITKNTSKWTNLGYTCINTGRSSRHPERSYITYLCYKIIDPTTKGYVQ